jgi:putative transposase
MIRTHKIKLLPNAKMRHILDANFGYARYCYNQALEIWNTMYESYCVTNDKSFQPNHYKVRNTLVDEKEDWQYNYSSRILQQACFNLNRAWKNFFNPNMVHAKPPKFKSKRNHKQSFTTDRAKVVNNYLVLDHPRQVKYDKIRMTEFLRFTGTVKTTTITKRGDKYFASIVVEISSSGFNAISDTGIDAIDMNIQHLNTRYQVLNTLPQRLLKKYDAIKHYNRLLAGKRKINPKHFRSHNYVKIQKKMNQSYLDIYNIQQDAIQKFSTNVLKQVNTIVLEDLDVNKMKMNRRIAKNVHRGLFGRTRLIFEYKARLQHKAFILADRFYPSTQRCSNCGNIKTATSYGGKQTLSGDKIHHEHQNYYCYNCGTVINRDKNAVENLIQYAAGLSAATV